MHIVVSAPGHRPGGIGDVPVTASVVDAGAVVETISVPGGRIADLIRDRERDHPRWVWDDTRRWYPGLLAAGVRVERCIDLRLCHTILRHCEWVDATWPDEDPWLGPWPDVPAGLSDVERTAPLFDVDPVSPDETYGRDSVAEFELHCAIVERSSKPGALRLLLAGESAGALVAAEMKYAGMPWNAQIHENILVSLLGPRPTQGSRPHEMARLAQLIQNELSDPKTNPDSPQDLLRAMRRAGIAVSTTRSWELKEIDHPAIPFILAYKKLARLLSANGWNWLDSWVRESRFHPEYVVGGVVTGRWASVGGGALQLPKDVRSAGVSDDGWVLVVADAAQLEPRVLAAMAGDRDMARAGSGADFYQGIVDSGIVETRTEAKYALLGALYGSTTGESAVVMPRLAKAYPRAIGLVEAAARTGERGGVVTTLLGRSSPRPGPLWSRTQADATEPEAGRSAESRARTQARAWGRFTRNFVVQGTAAEWALCWMAFVRSGLREMSSDARILGLARAPFDRCAHLVFFVHDELVVHCPLDDAERVQELVEDAAARAGRLLFGEFPIEFPVSVAIVNDYGAAK